jgi:spermidine synthase/Tfp pilus assembly protein PilF
MGATFPLAAGFVAGGAGDVGRAVGKLYAGNTIGGIAGSMLAGFAAIPMLGTQRTLLLLLLANVTMGVVGLGLAWRTAGTALPWRRRAVVLGAVAVALGLVLVGFLTPRWDPYVLDAGIAVGGPSTAHGDRTLTAREVGRGSDILWYREGLNANISVRKDETQLYLKTNGKTDGTSRGDMPTQLMLGLLPSLVHPDPQRTLVVGLGTGASARAALVPPDLQRLDVVEIEPAVVEAARRYFGVVNRGLFSDARARLWVEDARAFLLTTPLRYDIIVSEPSNPWIAGVASLFTVDHYRRCAEQLVPGGLVAQWLQIYALPPELVRMVMASMRVVFPHQAVWSFHHGDLIVLGSREPLAAIDLQAMEARLEKWGVRGDLRRILGVGSAAGVVGFQLLDDVDTGRFAAGARLNTEDRPRLEFAAPMSLYLTTRDSNAALLRAARQGPFPDPAWALRGIDRLDMARAALLGRRAADALQRVDEALTDPTVPQAAALALKGEIGLAMQQAGAAEAALQSALGVDPQCSDAANSLAVLRLLQGRNADAEALLDVACAPDPSRIPQQLESRAQLLSLVLQRGGAEAARSHSEALLAADGFLQSDSTLRARFTGIAARSALELRDAAGAERLARQALALDAQSTTAWRVLGTLAFEDRRYVEAIGWWERCVDYRQSDPELLLPLALACQRAARPQDARRYVDRVLAQEPRNATARRLRDELR